MLKKFSRIFTALTLFLCVQAVNLFAYEDLTEKIISFDSQIKVSQDASMDVIETIKVFAAGDKIKRGIYRDFPTRYLDVYGNKYVVDFNLQQVLKNGLSEKFRIEDLSNGKRVYIGDKDVYLSPGEYTYTISYTTNRQLGFFKDFDELYWNVTGNGWGFDIENATATVELPQGAGILNTTGYTGYQGSKQKDFISHLDDFGRAVFETTRKFNPNEGLTIVVSWPKGFVQEPKLDKKIYYIFRDNSSAIVGLLGLLILLGYYFLVWSKFGKDPEKGVIIPLFEPPAKLSPAALRFIMKMGFDHKAFAAQIVNMAVKGYLVIEERAGSYALFKTGSKSAELNSEELKTAGLLFGHGNEIELKNDNHSEINAAIENLKRSFRMSYENIYFFTNIQYFIPGALISALVVFLVLILQSGNKAPISLFMSVWVTFWSFGVIMILRQVFSAWNGFFSGGSNKIFLFGQAVFLSLFCLPFVGGEIFGLSMLFFTASALGVLILAGLIAINILFYYLLKAPSLAGRKIMDQIEGFKLYLSVAEKDRLNMLNPPEMTPELFEKYLPFALALDVEQAWAEQFSQVFAGISKDGKSYTPLWYSGPSWNNFGAGGFCSGLSGSFSSAIASSSVAPGSASGGGGGGSSGGGGGGGGGGGW